MPRVLELIILVTKKKKKSANPTQLLSMQSLNSQRKIKKTSSLPNPYMVRPNTKENFLF